MSQWYWLCRIGKFLSYLGKDFNYLCHVTVVEWHKMQIYVIVPSENLACKELRTHCIWIAAYLQHACSHQPFPIYITSHKYAFEHHIKSEYPSKVRQDQSHHIDPNIANSEIHYQKYLWVFLIMYLTVCYVGSCISPSAFSFCIFRYI